MKLKFKKLLFIVFLFSVRNLIGQEISIIGVGDMMLGTDYPSPSYLSREPKNILTHVQETLKSADLTFGNIEGVIAENIVPVTKKCSNPKVCYAFRMPPYQTEYFKNSGFDMVSLANNHSGDCGKKGRERTMYHLEKNGIGMAGIYAHPVDSFMIREKKVCLIAFSPNRGTLSINDVEGAEQRVRKLEKNCAITIVSFHGGAEGEKHQHVKNKTEYYYGENRGNVVDFSHRMIDAGADIIFGHGPHVLRAVEVYKDRFIAYSLGNFATYGRFSLRGAKGLGVIVRLSVNGSGKFQKAKILSTKQIQRGIPVFDETKAAFKKIQLLTDTDFPNHRLHFDFDNETISGK